MRKFDLAFLHLSLIICGGSGLFCSLQKLPLTQTAIIGQILLTIHSQFFHGSTKPANPNQLFGGVRPIHPALCIALLRPHTQIFLACRKIVKRDTTAPPIGQRWPYLPFCLLFRSYLNYSFPAGKKLRAFKEDERYMALFNYEPIAPLFTCYI